MKQRWRPQHFLKDLGVQIYVDDFGTGHSSLASLPFPVDALRSIAPSSEDGSRGAQSRHCSPRHPRPPAQDGNGRGRQP